MQGVIKAYDPHSQWGLILADQGGSDIDLATNALEGSIFRFLRPGQRVNFDLSDQGEAINVRFGSETDMLTPGPPPGT